MERHIIASTSNPSQFAPLVSVIRTIMQHQVEMIGLEALVHHVSLCPTDVVMIDMQSEKAWKILEVFKQLHQNIPVIAAVTYGHIEMIERVLQMGADDYISQPIALERLKATIRNMLRLRNLLLIKSGNGHASPDVALRSSAEGVSDFFICHQSGKMNSLQSIEHMAIKFAVERCGGCISKAAKELGIGRSTLYRKLKENVDFHTQTVRANQITRPMTLVSSREISYVE